MPNTYLDRWTAPYVLVEVTSQHWRIMGPDILFGEEFDNGDYTDRRYVEVCTVFGPLRDALDRLGQLERGRAASQPGT